MLLIQEPYLDRYGNTKATKDWRVIYPSSRLSLGNKTRSVIMVNAALDTNHWAQLMAPESNDLSAIQLKDDYGRLIIFNIYNNCDNSKTEEKLVEYLRGNRQQVRTHETDYMLWCGNFNRHHPLWDSERNHHLFMASVLWKAGKLLGKVGDYNMVMTLPKNTSTLKAKSTKNWTRPNNVFCSENTADLIVICDMDPQLRGPGTDHIPILTNVELPVICTVIPPTYNFRMVDWEEFNKELEARLVDIPPPEILATKPQFEAAVHDITETLRDVIHTTVTLTKPFPLPPLQTMVEQGPVKPQKEEKKAEQPII
jgi:hypothetical protein